jgi:hypothetical protein
MGEEVHNMLSFWNPYVLVSFSHSPSFIVMGNISEVGKISDAGGV